MQVPGLCAGIYSVLYSKWAGNKRAQSLQSGQAKKKKASERNLSAHYAFLMPPVSLFPLLRPFTPPFHHFPLGSDKEELALVPPFLHAFQGYSRASFSPPVSVWRPVSLHPSLFVPHILVPIPFPSTLICPYPSSVSAAMQRVRLQLVCRRPEESWPPAACELLLKRSLSSWFDKIQAISHFF